MFISTAIILCIHFSVQASFIAVNVHAQFTLAETIFEDNGLNSSRTRGETKLIFGTNIMQDLDILISQLPIVLEYRELEAQS